MSDANDPAVASVEELRREFPDCAMQLVVCSEILGANVKVSNLERMAQSARYEHLIVNDSDIQVERDYLRRVIAPLTDEHVGMVTCLYRGVAAATFGSQLESLGISTDFCAGVLVAQQIEGGLRFGLDRPSRFVTRISKKFAVSGQSSIFWRTTTNWAGGLQILASGLCSPKWSSRRIFLLMDGADSSLINCAGIVE